MQTNPTNVTELPTGPGPCVVCGAADLDNGPKMDDGSGWKCLAHLPRLGGAGRREWRDK